MQQVPPNVSMGHPGTSGPHVYPPGESADASLQSAEVEVDVEQQQHSPAPTEKGKNTKKCVSRTKLGNFNLEEDVNLVKSWLEISCDPITSTGQEKDHMWERILQRYNFRRGSNPERSVRSLQSRWDNVKAEVGKFAAFYANAIRENPSGMSDADKVNMSLLFVLTQSFLVALVYNLVVAVCVCCIPHYFNSNHVPEFNNHYFLNADHSCSG
jgi:hypothetical protein